MATLVSLSLFVLAGDLASATERRLESRPLPAPFAERWLLDHGDLLTSSERNAFARLESDPERLHFDQRFWASRDSDPATLHNEAEDRRREHRRIAIEAGLAPPDPRYLLILRYGEPDTFFQLGGCEPRAGAEPFGGRVLGAKEGPRCDLGFDLMRWSALPATDPSARGRGGGDSRSETEPLSLMLREAGDRCVIVDRPGEMGEPGSSVIGRARRPGCRALEQTLEGLLTLAFRNLGAPTSLPRQATVEPAGADDSWLEDMEIVSRRLVSGELEALWRPTSRVRERRSAHRELLGEWRTTERVLGDLRLRLPASSLKEIGRPRRLSLSFVPATERGAPVISERQRVELLSGAGSGLGWDLRLALNAPSGPHFLVVGLEGDDGASLDVFGLDDFETDGPSGGSISEPVSDEPWIRFVPLLEPFPTGRRTIELVAGGRSLDSIQVVADGKRQLAQRVGDSDLFRASIDFGSHSRPHDLTAIARYANGEIAAVDRLRIGSGSGTLRLSVLGTGYDAADGTIRPRLEMEVPRGASLEQIDLLQGEQLLASLGSDRAVPTLELTEPFAAAPFVLARARLTDGRSVEAASLLGDDSADGTFEQALDVDLIELFFSARDRSGRGPDPPLRLEEVSLLENGNAQALRRLQPGTDLPLTLALLIDTSRSVSELFPLIRRGAKSFFESVLRPGDLAAVIAFSTRFRLLAPLTSDPERLDAGLARLQPDRGTSLHDAVAHAARHLGGREGRKAVVVLSDGEELQSELSPEEAIRVARNLGVTVYTVRVSDRALQAGRPGRADAASRRRREALAGQVLVRLATATGGLAFEAGSEQELSAVYDELEADLRSQYLAVYQSTSGESTFRRLELSTTRQEIELRHPPGYEP